MFLPVLLLDQLGFGLDGESLLPHAHEIVVGLQLFLPLHVHLLEGDGLALSTGVFAEA